MQAVTSLYAKYLTRSTAPFRLHVCTAPAAVPSKFPLMEPPHTASLSCSTDFYGCARHVAAAFRRQACGGLGGTVTHGAMTERFTRGGLMGAEDLSSAAERLYSLADELTPAGGGSDAGSASDSD